MYIALKWLFGMVLAMWIGLCSLDIYLKQSVHLQLTEFNKLNVLGPPLENSTIFIKRKSYQRIRNKIHPVPHKSMLLQYTTLIGGACLVFIYYRKNDLLYTIIKLKSINKHEMKKHLRLDWIQFFKITANSVGVAILKILDTSRDIFEQFRIYLITKYKLQSTARRNPQNINLLLLNKLREYSQERRNLGHILFAAMQENKYIRMQYQLETLAKKRLVKQIEDSQRQIKENRSRYVSFQQLYIITHQENNFLKSRVRKLTQDKEEAERNLIKLVNYVWQSKNNELKAYCSHLIVKNKNNLLNSDARKEIDKFIKSSKTKPTDESRTLDTIKEVNENFHEEDVNILVKDAPKLRGLPGECVWTVKDKDGFIEKLYEYETDFDNGDTIRRIRQYSVYFDKDCLLDVSSSTTLIQNTNIDLSSLRTQYMTSGSPRTENSRYPIIPNDSTTVYFIMSQKLQDLDLNSVLWKSTRNEGLDIEYAVPIPKAIADAVLQELEETLTYFTGDLAKIKVFGKVYPLPRQQVAYGDPGITYRYSGTTVPALPWPQPVLFLRDFLFKLKGIKYDFVLVNKYRNGSDHMGEHRDNEPDLDPTMPIASISFGQERPFVLKHKDARKPAGAQRKDISPVIIKLGHGSVLLMNPPTNDVWYHSLPTRKKLLGSRINLTFRKMRVKNLIK